MKCKIPWLVILAISLTIMWIAVLCLGMFGYIKLDGRIRALESQVAQSFPPDMQSAIEFMKDQVQILIWLLSVIIAGAGAISIPWGDNPQIS